MSILDVYICLMDFLSDSGWTGTELAEDDSAFFFCGGWRMCQVRYCRISNVAEVGNVGGMASIVHHSNSNNMHV